MILPKEESISVDGGLEAAEAPENCPRSLSRQPTKSTRCSMGGRFVIYHGSRLESLSSPDKGPHLSSAMSVGFTKGYG